MTHSRSQLRSRLPPAGKEDGGEGDEAEGEGIVEIADDGDGGNAREAGGHQHLGAVGDDALDEAGEGVEEAG